MSDVITNGIAIATIGACVATAGVVIGTGYAIYRGLTWLSERAKRDMERLEQELKAPPTHATTAEARKEFEKQVALLKAKAVAIPTLKDHADAAARILAVRQSPIGSFLTKAQWQQLCARPHTAQTFTAVFDQAAKRFTQANAACVSRSIREVAGELGFSREHCNQENQGKQTLVLADNSGRALVAEIISSEDGTKLNLDLTGFANNSCHAVMDGILEGLAKRDVRIGEAERRSHYQRDGVLASSRRLAPKSRKVVRSVSPEEERQESLARRQRANGLSRLGVKQ